MAVSLPTLQRLLHERILVLDGAMVATDFLRPGAYNFRDHALFNNRITTGAQTRTKKQITHIFTTAACAIDVIKGNTIT